MYDLLIVIINNIMIIIWSHLLLIISNIWLCQLTVRNANSIQYVTQSCKALKTRKKVNCSSRDNFFGLNEDDRLLMAFNQHRRAATQHLWAKLFAAFKDWNYSMHQKQQDQLSIHRRRDELSSLRAWSKPRQWRGGVMNTGPGQLCVWTCCFDWPATTRAHSCGSAQAASTTSSESVRGSSICADIRASFTFYINQRLSLRKDKPIALLHKAERLKPRSGLQ